MSIAPLDGAPLFADLSGGPEYWPLNRVSALLSPETDLDILLASLRRGVGTANMRNIMMEALEDQDWTAVYRSRHGPLVFGDRLCICPSWARPLPAPCVIVLDPGLAFGTGSHGTTTLCLEWLVQRTVQGKDVIDYGCGSGVLGLAAAALGARRVLAVDNDPQAVSAARANVERNRLGGTVHVSLCGEVELPAVDILVANILLQPLVELADTFRALVKPGGVIALSGILAVQVGACVDAYQPWFDMAAPQFRNEWALLHGTRYGGYLFPPGENGDS